MYEPQTVPLSIGGVLDRGFALFKTSFKRVILLSLIGAFLTNVPGMILGATADLEQPGDSTGVALLAFAFTTMLISMIFFCAIVLQIEAAARNQSLSPLASLGTVLKRLFPLVLCLLLYWLIVSAGIVLLIVPGIIFALSLSFAFYLLVLDGLGPVASLKRSHQLVWGHWWRTAIALTVVAFVSIAAYGLLTLILGATEAFIGEGSLESIIRYLATPLLTALITPVFYALGLTILQDLKLRKGGADLSARLDAINTQ